MYAIPDNIYPARGRKPLPILRSVSTSQFNSRQYLPRKGTETKRTKRAVTIAGALIPDNIYPARGRKRSILLIPIFQKVDTFPTIFTPQGDGNRQSHTATDLELPFYSRQYLPRKGTETIALNNLEHPKTFAFPTIFTPQGDGNLVRKPRKLDGDRIPDNIYPARGRKHQRTR